MAYLLHSRPLSYSLNLRPSDQLDSLIDVFNERTFRNRAAQIEQDRQRAEREDIASVFAERNKALPTDRMPSAQEYWRATSGVLPRFYKHGEAGNKAVEQLLKQTELEVKAIPEKEKILEPKAPTEVDTFTGEDRRRHSTFYDPETKDYFHLDRAGQRVRGPADIGVLRDESGAGEDKAAKRVLDGLLAKKKGLEAVMARDPKLKNISLDKLLTGDVDIPEEDEVKLTQQVDRTTGQTQYIPIPTGRKVPNKTVQEWLDTVARSEELMTQRGEPFTPAKDIAVNRGMVTPEETKNLNGKVYVRYNGKWYERK